jgi:hypothetical protein
MGPTCEVLLDKDDGESLDAVDSVLAAVAEKIERTRKGRVWDIWVAGRPVHISIDSSPPSISLSAGCNSVEDYALLKLLAAKLTEAMNGVASEPIK